MRRQDAARDAGALYAAVALGSAIGAVLRALAALAIEARFGPGFPWATLFVNVTGSFAIGFYATLYGPDGRVLVRTYWRQLFMTGVCGGYTTFSAFSLETLRFLQAGQSSAAGLNVGVSVVGSLAAVWLGHAFAMLLNRGKGT
jgi:CrcB protein